MVFWTYTMYSMVFLTCTVLLMWYFGHIPWCYGGILGVYHVYHGIHNFWHVPWYFWGILGIYHSTTISDMVLPLCFENVHWYYHEIYMCTMVLWCIFERILCIPWYYGHLPWYYHTHVMVLTWCCCLIVVFLTYTIYTMVLLWYFGDLPWHFYVYHGITMVI